MICTRVFHLVVCLMSKVDVLVQDIHLNAMSSLMSQQNVQSIGWREWTDALTLWTLEVFGGWRFLWGELCAQRGKHICIPPLLCCRDHNFFAFCDYCLCRRLKEGVWILTDGYITKQGFMYRETQKTKLWQQVFAGLQDHASKPQTSWWFSGKGFWFFFLMYLIEG